MYAVNQTNTEGAQDRLVETHAMTGKEAAKSAALFAGRYVIKSTWNDLKTLHSILRIPCAMVGGLIGASVGLVGGAVYKAYKCARGQSDEARKLSDYVIKAAQVGYKAASYIGGAAIIAAAIPAYQFTLGYTAGTVILRSVIAACCVHKVYNEYRDSGDSETGTAILNRTTAVNNVLDNMENCFLNWRKHPRRIIFR